MRSTSPLLSRTSLLMVGLLAQGLTRFLYTVVIGRISGPETLGEVNAVLSLAVYLSLFWPAGLGVAGSRFIPSVSHGNSAAAATITTLKRSFWISTSMIVPVGVALAWWLTRDLWSALAAGVLIGTYGGYTFVRGTLLGQDKVRRIAVVDSVSSLAALSLLLVVVALDATPILLLPLSAGYLAFTVIGWPRSMAASLDATLKRQLRAFTMASIVWLVAAGGLLPTTMVFAQLFATAREAGVFAAAMTLATPANMIAQALSQVLVPFLSARSHEPEVVRSLSRRLFIVSVLGFAAVFGALALLTPWLLETFYGSEYASGVQVMYWLLLGVFLSSCATSPIATLLSTDRERIVSGVSVVAVIVGTASMAGLAPMYGVAGVVAGYVGASALILLALLVAMERTWRYREPAVGPEDGVAPNAS